MAGDTVSTQTIESGPRNLVMNFTNESDGTGESNVVKVDVSALGLSTTSLKVRKIEYNVVGGAVYIKWDASTDNPIAYLSGYGCFDWTDTQGITNPATTGNTGDILFSTSGFNAAAGTSPTSTAASGYTITLYMIKGNAP